MHRRIVLVENQGSVMIATSRSNTTSFFANVWNYLVSLLTKRADITWPKELFTYIRKSVMQILCSENRYITIVYENWVGWKFVTTITYVQFNSVISNKNTKDYKQIPCITHGGIKFLQTQMCGFNVFTLSSFNIKLLFCLNFIWDKLKLSDKCDEL